VVHQPTSDAAIMSRILKQCRHLVAAHRTTSGPFDADGMAHHAVHSLSLSVSGLAGVY